MALCISTIKTGRSILSRNNNSGSDEADFGRVRCLCFFALCSENLTRRPGFAASYWLLAAATCARNLHLYTVE